MNDLHRAEGWIVGAQCAACDGEIARGDLITVDVDYSDSAERAVATVTHVECPDDFDSDPDRYGFQGDGE